MKVCVKAHVVPSFSDNEIPVGAIFADDSEYITKANAKHFVAIVDDKET